MLKQVWMKREGDGGKEFTKMSSDAVLILDIKNNGNGILQSRYAGWKKMDLGLENKN